MSIAVSHIWQQTRENRPQALVLACFASFAALLLTLAAIALLGHARDGEPVVSVDLTSQRASVARSVVRPLRPAAGPQRAGPPTVPSKVAAAAPPVVTPASRPASVPRKIDKPIYAGSALVADPALTEETDQGPVPRIAEDGRKPMTAFAPPVVASGAKKIAIVVTGLGLSARETPAALDALPAGITLAFAPYADDVQSWATEARRKGHEVLLEVPMEPYDFPDSDPGPHTLRAASSEQSNLTRLTWALSRFTGYAGVTNLLGGRFLADSDSLAPVLTYLTRHGLLFFDASSPAHAATPDVARQVGAPYVHSAVTIDAIESATEIDARLSDVEAHARADGAAAGTGFAYPVTVDRIGNWARDLPGRGFVLVPASAIVAPTK